MAAQQPQAQAQAPKGPNLKKIILPPFTGKPNEIGIEKYLRAFERAEESDIQLNQTTWSDDVRYHVLVQKLSGPAATWLDEALVKSPPAAGQHPWEWIQAGLRAKFPITATIQQIRTALCKCKKIEGETWTAYSQCLELIESTIDADNMDLVRLMLCSAEPQHTATITALVKTEGANATAVEEIVAHLTHVTGHDGSQQSRRARVNLTKSKDRERNRDRNKKDKRACEICKRNNHSTQECYALKRAIAYIDAKENASKEQDFPLRG